MSFIPEPMGTDCTASAVVYIILGYNTVDACVTGLRLVLIQSLFRFRYAVFQGSVADVLTGVKSRVTN